MPATTDPAIRRWAWFAGIWAASAFATALAAYALRWVLLG